MSKPANDKVYFPNLDGLRLVCTLVIIILHNEELKVLNGRNYSGLIKSYLPMGSHDVSSFFVLSGFLITYLLLKEKQDTGAINTKKYYFRRALRIWPLYYFIIIIGFFLLPYLAQTWNMKDLRIYSSHKFFDFILCMLFLQPGTAMRAIGATWSVRVEEMFYVFEPLILKRTKKYVPVFISIIIAVILFRNGYSLICRIFHIAPVFHKIIAFYRLSCMAIGGIGAYLVITEKKRLLKIIYRKDFQWGAYILTVGLLLFRVEPPYIGFEIYAVLFCLIIINLATNPDSILKLDFKWTNYFGKVTYGLYLYSAILRIFCLTFTEKMYSREIGGWQMNLVYYFTTFASTIVISVVSYEFFEQPFLRRKNRLEVVKTEA